MLLNLLLFAVPTLFAAQSLTFESALERARDHNPQLQKAEAAANGAAWRPYEALGQNIPRLQVNGTHLFDVEYGYFPLPKNSLTVGAYWTVFDGFQGINAFRSGRRIHQAADKDLERAQFQTQSDLRTAFYRALASQALVAVTEENVKALHEHLDTAQEMLVRGSSTKFDVLRTQVQVEEAEADLQQAKDQLANSYLQLATLMGEDNADWDLSGTLPEPTSLNDTEATQLQNSENLEAESSRLRADAASIQSSSLKGNYFPRLTLYGERQYYNNSNFVLRDHYNNAHAVGVNLVWTIFDLSSIAKERQVAYAADESAASSRLSSLQTQNDRDTWIRRLRYSQFQYRAKKRAEEFAHEALRLAKLSFSAGTRTSTDVLDAQVDLFRAKAGILKAQIDNIEAKGKLETAYGKSL